MDDREIAMHLKAARAAGKESACGVKLQHTTLLQAEAAAQSLNHRKEVLDGTRNRVEPYPCPFCSPNLVNSAWGRPVYLWHVGREMTPEEREQYREA